MMSSFDAVHGMTPAARAIAEVRAREVGMGLAEWLEAIVYAQAAHAPARTVHGAAVWLDPLSRSTEPSAAIRPSELSEVDAETYSPSLRSAEIETSNLKGIFAAYPTREQTSSALQMIAAFSPRISYAAILLSAAFAEADVAFRLPPDRPSGRHKTTSRWYHALVETCLHRSREVQSALVHPWTPSGRAERLWGDAFFTLCDLTPARRELLALFHHDRSRACAELAKYLELATQQFELSANLLAEVEAPLAAQAADEQRFKQLRLALLARAGGGVSLTQGAERLGVTRQALHKRIKSGAALGMMDGDALVLPALQFVTDGDEVKLVKGLSDVVRLFERAGGWSALQFLVENDPNLDGPPIETLKSGKVSAVVAAARAHLGLDEG
jgi:hypothetical protein